MTLGEAQANLQACAQRCAHSRQSMVEHAKATGRALGTLAVNIRAGGQSNARLHAAVAAQEAFQQRVSAEARRYEAAYLLSAQQARQEAVRASMKALDAPSAHAREGHQRRARYASEQAQVLEQAATGALEAVRSVPVPDVVSTRRTMGLDAGGTVETIARAAPGWAANSQYTSPLLLSWFPEEVRRASSALSGLGDTEGTSYFDAVKQALAQGASAIGRSAVTSGQKVAKTDAAASVALTTSGSLLDSLAMLLGGEQDKAQVEVERKQSILDYWPVLAVGGAVLGGVWLLKRKG